MRVHLDNLRAEMVLAADIVDGMGRLLLPGGTTLTDRHLRYCQMWGIADAEIATDELAEAPPEATLDPERLAAAAALLERRFRHCDRAHPVIETLFQYCVEREALRGP